MADHIAQSMAAFMHQFTSTDVETWREQAACRGKTHLFFPAHKVGRPDPEVYDAARLICRACPVLEDCRRWVDTLQDRPYGFIAGMSAHERQELRRARRQVKAVTS